jgi:hypothetical protein
MCEKGVVRVGGIARVAVNCPATQRLCTFTLASFKLTLAGSQLQSAFPSLEVLKLFNALSSSHKVVC